MNATLPIATIAPAPAPLAWRIIHVLYCDYGRYGLALERDDGESATAMVHVQTRHSRSARHELFAPELEVEKCNDAGASAWLEEHAYDVAWECLRAK